MKGILAGHPRDLVLLQEAVAPVLPSFIFVRQPQLLQERQTLSLGLQEAGHVELPDLLSRHSEDFAQGRIARQGRAIGLLDQPAPLEPDDRVHLLLRKLLHNQIINNEPV